ncbi:MAG: GNAT family N-acetyltransferase [Prosthecobacter sp.]
MLHLHGPDLEPCLDALGSLRLQVFREYPYLYEGTLDDERQYLRSYAESPSSLVILAMDGDTAVGATTCLRMSEAESPFRVCFEKAGHDPSLICYFGESILLPAYRGRGIGKQFFEHRENHARKLRLQTSAFCAVDRPLDHPARPAGYRPLDSFWQAQGYEKHPEWQATFIWKEIHEASESPKTLTFWTKNLV